MFWPRNEMRNEMAFCRRFLSPILDNFQASSAPDPLAPCEWG
jgi:hypothetical protein